MVCRFEIGIQNRVKITILIQPHMTDYCNHSVASVSLKI